MSCVVAAVMLTELDHLWLPGLHDGRLYAHDWSYIKATSASWSPEPCRPLLTHPPSKRGVVLTPNLVRAANVSFSSWLISRAIRRRHHNPIFDLYMPPERRARVTRRPFRAVLARATSDL